MPDTVKEALESCVSQLHPSKENGAAKKNEISNGSITFLYLITTCLQGYANECSYEILIRPFGFKFTFFK